MIKGKPCKEFILHSPAINGQSAAWAQFAVNRAANTAASAPPDPVNAVAVSPQGATVTGSTVSPVSNDLLAALQAAEPNDTAARSGEGSARTLLTTSAPPNPDYPKTIVSHLLTLAAPQTSGVITPTSTPLPETAKTAAAVAAYSAVAFANPLAASSRTDLTA